MQTETKIKNGSVYNYITLTGRYEYRKLVGGRRLYAEGVCECGDIRYYAFRFLTNGNTKSCGCKRKENAAKALRTHGLSSHPLYTVYMDMMTRCYSQNCAAYKDYGGRGIKVCQEWIDDIFSFREWAMLNGYENGLQLDREKNDGNYCPDNCRFVTKDENNKNTRRTIFVTAFGETKVATDWAKDKRCKVKTRTLMGRFKVGGWSNEDAITTPAHGNTSEIMREKQGVKLSAFGETKSQAAWSEDERCKVGYSGLAIRLRKGWGIEDAISTPPLRKENKKAVIVTACKESCNTII